MLSFITVVVVYVADEQFGLHGDPPTTGAGAVPESVACLPVDPVPLNECLVWPQWERIHLVTQWLDMGGGGYTFLFSKDKEKVE